MEGAECAGEFRPGNGCGSGDVEREFEVVEDVFDGGCVVEFVIELSGDRPSDGTTLNIDLAGG